MMIQKLLRGVRAPAMQTVYLAVGCTGWLETRDEWIVGIYCTQEEAAHAATQLMSSFKGLPGHELTVGVLIIPVGVSGHYELGSAVSVDEQISAK